MLQGHVPPAIARFHLLPMNLLPVTNRLNLAIGLPLRNHAALDKLLSEIYDPASTNYHRYLTPEQFATQFGPAEQDYQSLIHFAETNGLTVTATYPNRALLDVSGDAATVERVFHVKLNVYQHPTESRTFFAPDAEPSIDFSVPILHISGLDNYLIPHPAVLKKNPLNNRPTGVLPASGSAPDGSSYMGNDFRAAYAPGVKLNGGGQAVALLELDGYYTNDITAYESLAGLPNITLTNILIDGFSGSAGGNNMEVALDIEMVIAMATNLTQVAVYEAQNNGNNANIVDMLNTIVTNNLAKQISSSWIIGDDANFDTAYIQMAAQGQSFFQASGDDGAYYTSDLNEEWADDTNITLVGGTTLYTTGPGGSWSSETAWNWSITDPPNVGATGGGTNYNGIPIPSWQTGINMTTNQGSVTLRNVPDVALTADSIWVIYDNKKSESLGGTSAAAPLWAGFTALINQQATNMLKPPVGFLNPAIYAIGKSAKYAVDFHDITTGNNTNKTVHNKYYAVPGYDLCTGWGTPNGTNLIDALIPLDPLGIVPSSGFVASDPAGGPFSPASQNFYLTNSGASPLTWSLVNTSAWLNVSSTSGTLGAGATNGFIISLVVAAANSLPIGSYTATVNLTNWNTHVVQSLQFTLLALQPLVVTPPTGFTATGPVAGPFSPSTGSFQLTNTGNTSLTWSLINTSAWLTASGGGTLATNATNTATVNLGSAAASLASGTYSANVWFTNQSKGGAISRLITLLVSQPLVQNGGFETGNFTGWILTNDNYSFVDDGSYSYISPHSGTYFAALGAEESPGFISQGLQTVANQSYLLSLWFNSPNVYQLTSGALTSNTPNEFSVSWNGNTLFNQTNIPPISGSGWTNLQFIVTATSSNSLLQFSEMDDPWYLGLDDVSVTPIPAAIFQTTTVTKTNNNFKFAWNAATGIVYQVQYKTNLLQTNWFTLKSITATNTAITFVDTNPISGIPQKFYRLLLSP